MELLKFLSDRWNQFFIMYLVMLVFLLYKVW